MKLCAPVDISLCETFPDVCAVCHLSARPAIEEMSAPAALFADPVYELSDADADCSTKQTALLLEEKFAVML